MLFGGGGEQGVVRLCVHMCGCWGEWGIEICYYWVVYCFTYSTLSLMHVVIEGLCTWEMHLLLLLCLPSSGGGGAVRGDNLPVGDRLKGLVQPVWAVGFWSQRQRHPCSCRHPWQLLTRLEVQPLGTQGTFSSTFLVSPLRFSVYMQVATIYLGMSDQLVTFCVYVCVQ